MNFIYFNRPFFVGNELPNIAEAVDNGHLAGDGMFTKKCHAWLENTYSAKKALLTHSCTGALEMAAILADIRPGDEVILPSYTFVSTANAFVLRGATLRFIDIRPDTLNLDENLIEAAVTDKTKVICPVHYAGVGCEMDAIMDIAKRHDLLVIEDAAQGMNATYNGEWLGTLGHFGAYSFHETKNFISGEGGALLINDERFIERAEIIREKGTNRSKFFRGEVDKYTWVDIGSSYLPSELIAAFLYAQLEKAERITEQRLTLWNRYYEHIAPLEQKGCVRIQHIPENCTHNAHMFYLILNTPKERDDMLAHLKANGIRAVFHYIPLHTSPMGSRFGYGQNTLPVTEDLAPRLLRLPMYFELSEEEQLYIADKVRDFFKA
jgi:dTDP-4-amino-4,6-dideoxygalactose transaminase